MRRRKSVTLIEILLVVSLLAIVFSIVGFFLYKGIQKEKFLADTALVLEKMATARDLAVQMDMEVRFNLLQDDSGIGWAIEGDKLLQGAAKVIAAQTKTLNAISSMSFEGNSVHAFEIVFSRMGTASPKGNLTLFPNVQGRKRDEEAIVIRTFPFPHFLREEEVGTISRDLETNLFPRELSHE